MKVEELRDAYSEATETASSLVRQFNLAGIAVVWLFRGSPNAAGISWSPVLLWPLILFVVSLSCDLLQYLYKSIVWGSLNWYFYRKYRSNDKDIQISGTWNWIAVALFWTKAAAVAIAYGLLVNFLRGRLR